jgi:aminopeptidase N
MSRKFQGINADILNTTHPVTSGIKSVAEADSVFNGISYGKGASFLKQLNKVMGQDYLKTALHNYFQKYQWKNTEFDDFIGTLEETYITKNDQSMGENFNFKEWCDEWLKTSGVDTLVPQVELNANKSLVHLTIKQIVDPAGHNRLRKSKIDIGIYDKDYKRYLIKDFVISDTVQSNSVPVELLKQV